MAPEEQYIYSDNDRNHRYDKYQSRHCDFHRDLRFERRIHSSKFIWRFVQRPLDCGRQNHPLLKSISFRAVWARYAGWEFANCYRSCY